MVAPWGRAPTVSPMTRRRSDHLRNRPGRSARRTGVLLVAVMALLGCGTSASDAPSAATPDPAGSAPTAAPTTTSVASSTADPASDPTATRLAGRTVVGL